MSPQRIEKSIQITLSPYNPTFPAFLTSPYNAYKILPIFHFCLKSLKYIFYENFRIIFNFLLDSTYLFFHAQLHNYLSTHNSITQYTFYAYLNCTNLFKKSHLL